MFEKLKAADFILVGIGEEFDGEDALAENTDFQRKSEYMENQGAAWMIPLLRRACLSGGEKEEKIRKALGKLEMLLRDKDYFIINTSTTGFPEEAGFLKDRLVSPCGGFRKKQCPNACPEGLQTILPKEHSEYLKEIVGEWDMSKMGHCPKCGSNLVFNHVSLPIYDEAGYLEVWKQYTVWLEKTLNRRLLILELGVGLDYPTVIRFPFEKIGFYNQKADFFRVHEKWYQLPDHLTERAASFAQNSVDWLLDFVI